MTTTDISNESAPEAADYTEVVHPSDLLAQLPSEATLKRIRTALDASGSTVELLEALAQVLDGYEAPAAASLVRSIRHQLAVVEAASM